MELVLLKDLTVNNIQEPGNLENLTELENIHGRTEIFLKVNLSKINIKDTAYSSIQMETNMRANIKMI